MTRTLSKHGFQEERDPRSGTCGAALPQGRTDDLPPVFADAQVPGSRPGRYTGGVFENLEESTPLSVR